MKKYKLFISNNANFCVIRYNTKFKELSDCFYFNGNKSIIRFVSTSDGSMIQSEDDFQSTLSELEWIENNLEVINLPLKEIDSLYKESISLHLIPLCTKYKKEIEELKSSISSISLITSLKLLKEESNLANEKAKLEELKNAISTVVDMVNNKTRGLDSSVSGSMVDSGLKKMISYKIGDKHYILKCNGEHISNYAHSSTTYVSTTEAEVLEFYYNFILEINNISEIKLEYKDYFFSSSERKEFNGSYIFQGEDLEILKEKLRGN